MEILSNSGCWPSGGRPPDPLRAEGDWLKPCWWRHGLVVEELAALRVAWLAVYDGTSVSDASEGVKWHEQAEKCRQRIRKTISVGTGCSAGTHERRIRSPMTPVGKELTELGIRPRVEHHSAEEDPEPTAPGPSLLLIRYLGTTIL